MVKASYRLSTHLRIHGDDMILLSYDDEPGCVENEEGGGGEDQDDGEVVLLALALLHCLLSSEDSSLTSSIGPCGGAKT